MKFVNEIFSSTGHKVSTNEKIVSFNTDYIKKAYKLFMDLDVEYEIIIHLQRHSKSRLRGGEGGEGVVTPSIMLYTKMIQYRILSQNLFHFEKIMTYFKELSNHVSNHEFTDL